MLKFCVYPILFYFFILKGLVIIKKRYFNSATTDKLRVHNMGYQFDCGTINAIGNGEIMVYGRGPEWMHLCGAPYSCPPVFSLVSPQNEEMKCTSNRREDVGSWEHSFIEGKLIDCASRKYHCIARHWELNAPLRFEMDFHGFSVDNQGDLLVKKTTSLLITVPSDTDVFNDYPLGKNAYITLILKGDYAIEHQEDNTYLTLFNNGTLYAVGSDDFAECDHMASDAAIVDFYDILADADADDRAFLSDCAVKRAPLREHPLSALAEEAADEVALLIRAQQANCGGVQAGHNYHMAYIRDQYGVSRGLLAVGAWDNARAILEFYRDIFGKYGCLHNAQGIGTEKVFHIHENDLTEITGYLVLQAVDYFDITGDSDFFRSLIPMLQWALYAEISQLHCGMLPFNGDETYIAGHIIPRTVINHGSFEATLLFLTGTRRYLNICNKLGVSLQDIDRIEQILEDVSARFENNFLRGDTYVCNSIKRLEGLKEPQYRHGVCYFEDKMSWLRRVDDGCYVCPSCLAKGNVVPCRKEYNLKSSFLMAIFIGSDIISEDKLRQTVDSFIDDYRFNGRLPSLPQGDRCLGYDFGLLLYAAARLGSDDDDLLEHTLHLADEAGAWPEYFEGDEPKLTRCRPWESGINIAGIIEYLKK